MQENKTTEQTDTNGDEHKRFENALKVIETDSKKICVSVTNIEDLNRILAYRFIYQISKYDLSSKEFVIITATENEKTVLKNEINGVMHFRSSYLNPYFMTLHSFCLNFINANITTFNYENEFIWMSNGRKRIIISDVFKKIDLFKKEEFHKKISEIINLQETYDLTVGEALKKVLPQDDFAMYENKIDEFNKEYKSQCIKKGELDFNDMLALARDEFNKHPNIKLSFPQKIMFDISGKTNKLWKEIVGLVAQRIDNFFGVYLNKEKHELDEKNIEKTYVSNGFFSSIKNLMPTANWSFSDKDNDFRNYSLNNFLQQRYINEYFAKHPLANASIKNQQIVNSSKGGGRSKTDSWSESKKISESGLIEIGCDQVGISDYFGGIVTAAVVLQPGKLNNLPLNLIKSSKSLTDEQIYEYYEQLKKLVDFVVVEYEPCEYNKFFDGYDNANTVKAHAYNQALADLANDKKIDLQKSRIIIDRFVSSGQFNNLLAKVNFKQKIEIDRFENRAASKYASVALAWIFARHHFLEQIKRLQEQGGISIHLGSSDRSLLNTVKELYKQGGTEHLKQFVKFHFKPINKIVKSNSDKKD